MDSLVVGESIELIGSVVSTNPLCAGAVFLLQPGYDLSSPQPVTSIVGSLLLDGSRPFGYQASNRTITLPIEISVPGDSGTPAGFATLTAAREVLLREINQQTWSLRWTRDPGTGTPLPMLFDCFRAHATVVAWGGVDQLNRFPIGLLTISFDALPYGRTDVPVVVDFPSPLAGRAAPPPAIDVDTFSSVSGTQWAANAQSPVVGGQSAFWDPGITPASNPLGTGLAATYSKGSLALNLAAGWSATITATGTTTTFLTATASAAPIDIGDQFQLWTSVPALKENTIFTVTKISPPSGGNVTVTYTPASAVASVSTNLAIQTGPPSLNAVTFWAGFGSTLFYQNWARLGGRVQFAVTLTDTYSTALSFSKAFKVTGSNSSTAPRWNKIRLPVPYQAGFDYANVASYSITVTNRGTSDLRYTQLYLSNMQAAPPPVTVAPSPARGAVYELVGLPGTARAPVSMQFQQSGTQSYVKTFTLPGAATWLCPPGVSTVAVYNVGGGGPGGQVGAALTYPGGGGGGGTAANASVAVTPGTLYNLTVGAGGRTGSSPTAGGSSVFTGDSVTVTATGGGAAAYNGTTGGTAGAAGTGGFAGGVGGAGTNAGVGPTGGGGGSSGGSAGAGNAGATGAAGGAGGAAVTGGGKGGAGGTVAHSNGFTGLAPGGGGGGARPHVLGQPGGNGAAGQVQLTYTASLPLFQTLVAHRPPPDSPYALVPFVSPNPADTPNGTIQYPVGSLVPGVPARFAGTYTVVLGVWSWHSPSVSRTLTVTVTQVEQPGGAAYTASVSTAVIPNNLPSCPGTNASVGPLVVLGEVTLPPNDMPQDNTGAYFTVSVTSTDTADSFMDVLFLDTRGSTVMILSPTAYSNMFLDEPASDRDIGLIMGSLFDRGDAISILDRATVAGGPLSVDPDGNPLLLAYCAEGAPNAQLVFHPRWHLDRIT